MKLSLADFPLERYKEIALNNKARLETIRECGFFCIDFNIELRHLTDDFEEQAKSLKNDLATLNMTANQAHAPIIPFFETENENYLANYMELYERSLRFCEIAGIPQVVIHAGTKKGNTREEYFENNEKFYKSLIPFAEKTGVAVLVENIGHKNDDNYLLTGADLREMVDRINHPLFNICWDTGHANLNPQDTYESILIMGNKLTALHVHDNCGDFEPSYRHHRIDMHTMPYVTQYASVNYDALLQGLIEIGYKGTFNFEVLTMTRATRQKFVKNGEVVRTMENTPLWLWIKGHQLLHEIGRFLLGTYDLYEG